MRHLPPTDVDRYSRSICGRDKRFVKFASPQEWESPDICAMCLRLSGADRGLYP